MIRSTFLLGLTLWVAACTTDAEQTVERVIDAPVLEKNWMIINYWATWCAPCRKEIPELNRFAQRAPQYSLYAINYDDVQGEELLAAADDMGINFTLLAKDPAALLQIERPRVLPTTLIVSPQGKVVTTLIGPQSEEGLKLEMANAIGQKTSAAFGHGKGSQNSQRSKTTDVAYLARQHPETERIYADAAPL